MYYIVGAIMITIGAFIIYWVGKRRFNRRGPAGIQHFSSYGRSVFITWMERLAKLIGIALILLGMGALALQYDMDQKHAKSIFELHP